MAPIKCDACEQRYGQAPLEPCAVCKSWMDKLAIGKKEAEVIAKLVAENKDLNVKLEHLAKKEKRR